MEVAFTYEKQKTNGITSGRVINLSWQGVLDTTLHDKVCQ
jgi:hypothetical protein